MAAPLSLMATRVAEMLRNAGVPKAVELAALAEPSFKITTRRVPLAELAMGASRFGGTPDVLPGFTWPERDRRPLTFLAQLDLAEIRAPGVPDRGWMLFFYDAAGKPWGREPEDADGSAVLYLEANREALIRAEHPDPGFAGGPFEPCALAFEVVIDLPDIWDHIIEDHGLAVDRHNWEAFGSVADRLNGTEDGEDELPYHYHHHFLGHPQLVQDDMRSECFLVPKRLGAAGGGQASSERGKPQPSTDWRLLMQFDTDVKGPGWEWEGGGRLYYWIRYADLAARSFESVWVILQC